MRFAPKGEPHKRVPVKTVVAGSGDEVIICIQALGRHSVIEGQSRLFMSVPEARKLVKDITNTIEAGQ